MADLHPAAEVVLASFCTPEGRNPAAEQLAAGAAAALLRWQAANCPSNNEDGGTEDGLWFHTDLTEAADEIAPIGRPAVAGHWTAEYGHLVGGSRYCDCTGMGHLYEPNVSHRVWHGPIERAGRRRA